MFLTVMSSLINETNRFVISLSCYRGHSPDLQHCCLFCSNVNPSIHMLMYPETGHSTERTPLIMGSHDIDKLTKKNLPQRRAYLQMFALLEQQRHYSFVRWYGFISRIVPLSCIVPLHFFLVSMLSLESPPKTRWKGNHTTAIPLTSTKGLPKTQLAMTGGAEPLPGQPIPEKR